MDVQPANYVSEHKESTSTSNDAYGFFRPLGYLVITGPTHL